MDFSPTMTPHPSPAKTVFLEIQNPDMAQLKICGLTILERNLRALVHHGFTPIVITDQNLPTGNVHMVLRGDVQHDPDFFAALKKKLADTKPRFTDPQNLSANTRIPKLEHALFAHILKNTEGWIATTLNKKISFALTKHLVKTSITPNQITVFCFILGIVGSLLLAASDWGARAAGVLLIQFSSILDGCDGEVAKLKFIFSKWGAWMDTVSDDIINNVMLVCLFWGVYRDTGNPMILNYGIATLGASLSVSFFIYRYLFKHKTPNAAHFRLAWDKAVPLTSPTNTPKKSGWFDLVKPVLKRDFFIFISAVLVCLDLRGTLLILCGSIWGAFFLYLASFIYGIFGGKADSTTSAFTLKMEKS